MVANLNITIIYSTILTPENVGNAVNYHTTFITLAPGGNIFQLSEIARIKKQTIKQIIRVDCGSKTGCYWQLISGLLNKSLHLAPTYSVTKFIPFSVIYLITLCWMFNKKATEEYFEKTFKSDLSSTTKCDQNHISHICKFVHA
jgi:hypothetical protein